MRRATRRSINRLFRSHWLQRAVMAFAVTVNVVTVANGHQSDWATRMIAVGTVILLTMQVWIEWLRLKLDRRRRAIPELDDYFDGLTRREQLLIVEWVTEWASGRQQLDLLDAPPVVRDYLALLDADRAGSAGGR